MREFKFRAYVPEENKMYYNVWVDDRGYVLWWDNSLFDRAGGIINLGHSKRIHVMQYSEVTDNLNENIYEGDMVKSNDMGYFNFESKVVEFKYGMFCIKTEKELPYHPLYLFECLERIGNKWENPELVEN